VPATGEKEELFTDLHGDGPGQNGPDARLQEEGFDRAEGLHRPLLGAEKEAARPAQLLDHPGLGNAARDVHRPVQDPGAGQDLPQPLRGVHAVLEGDDDGRLPRDLREGPGGAVEVVPLDRDQDEVEGAEVSRPVRGPGRPAGELPVRSDDPESPAPDRLEVCAPRHEGDPVFVSGFVTAGQPAPVVAPHAADADNRDVHGVFPFFASDARDVISP